MDGINTKNILIEDEETQNNYVRNPIELKEVKSTETDVTETEPKEPELKQVEFQENGDKRRASFVIKKDGEMHSNSTLYSRSNSQTSIKKPAVASSFFNLFKFPSNASLFIQSSPAMFAKKIQEKFDIEEKFHALRDYVEEDTVKEREQWDSKEDFIFASIGSVVGLGNVLWFPYLCYQNGGGAYLIPYSICVMVLGIPISVLEISLGQFTSLGGLEIWRLVPICKGVGYVCIIALTLQIMTYNVILAWVTLYVWKSVDLELPWKGCDNWWNTYNCTEQHYIFNHTYSTTPVKEFWEKYALGMNDGSSLGELNVDLFLAYVVAWFITYKCISNGMKTSGKLSYATSTLPVALLFVFFVYSFSRNGAISGFKHFITPDFSKLKDPGVWWDAMIQVFLSSSLAMGLLPTVGSYNSFYYKSGKTTFQIALINSATSIFSGAIVFALLGHTSKVEGLEIDEVITGGPGLIFQTYPTEVLNMPFPQGMSFLYFLMCFLLGIDSGFFLVASLITSLVDQFPMFLRRGNRENIFTLLCCVLLFLCGIPMLYEGGYYVHFLLSSIIDRLYVVIAFSECVSIVYIYGGARFFANFTTMNQGSKVKLTIPFLKICLYVIDPLMCLALILFIPHPKSLARSETDVFYFPKWAIYLASVFEVSILLIIPVYALVLILRYRAASKPLKRIIKPKRLKRHQLLPGDDQQSWWEDPEIVVKKNSHTDCPENMHDERISSAL